jgi:molecular chaperone GrpE (heat shock protein)
MSRTKTQNTKTDTPPVQPVNFEENWKRALADYQNLLRRVEADKREFMKLSNVITLA